MTFLWRYGRELCYTLELIQILYAENDKENGVDFYNTVFPEEVKILGVIQAHETSPFDYRFKIIKRILSLL